MERERDVQNVETKLGV